MSDNPRRQPVHPQIDEEMIRALVHGFYDRVRADGEIGPIFNRVIGDDWDAHLAKMCDFWSSVMLMSGRYKGNPMVAHMRLKMVQPQHFERWLSLFRETARAVCPAPDRNVRIARPSRCPWPRTTASSTRRR